MVRHRLFYCLLGLAFLCRGTSGNAQAVAAVPAQPVRVSRYLDRMPLRFEALVPAPPLPGSAQAAEDLATVHRLQASRTPAGIEAAQRDDREESMFAYATVLGPRFMAASLPLTAALSLHLREESGVVNPALKVVFDRPRPFVADASVTPVCARTTSNSYPSGHAMVGYLEGFALAQMLPEKADAIVLRAADYAHNRVVCGVHYPSDVEASRTLAAALFGALATSPRFERELAGARAELRKYLGMKP